MNKPIKVTVEKGIPIPKAMRGQRRKYQRKYPFDLLTEVGQSFFLPDKVIPKPGTEKMNEKEFGHSVRASAYIYGKKHKVRLSCRDTGDGIRVWRVA